MAPPRSKWSLALYVAAALFALDALVRVAIELTAEGGAPLPGVFGSLATYVLESLMPALLLSVLGGAVQYLSDIRWALLRRLENNDA